MGISTYAYATIKILKNKNSTVIASRNFNHGYIVWDSTTIFPGCVEKAEQERLLEILTDRHLSQMKSEPT